MNYPSVHDAFAAGTAFLTENRLPEARSACEWILVHDPNHAPAWHQLAIIDAHSGQIPQSIDRFRKAISLQPQESIFHANLAMVLERQGMLPEALECYRQAVQLRPDIADLHYKLGNALRVTGQTAEATLCYQNAVRLDPLHTSALNNLGNILRFSERLEEAVACFQSALRINAADYSALANLAGTLARLDRSDESNACYRSILALKSDNPAFKETRARAAGCLAFACLFDPAAGAQTLAAELRQWNRFHDEIAGTPFSRHQNVPAPARRLRIGYVSADFRDHAVGRNLLPLFRGHDRAACELFCYSNSDNADPINAEFRRLADHYHSIASESDDRAATRIVADQIDILVDLSLHTSGNRLGIFVRKPAPIQVTFAGYPGSTGLPAIDYRISDPHLDPPSADDSIYTEQTLRLPHTFWCFDPIDGSPPLTNPPLAHTGICTFGSLNGSQKLNQSVLRLWAQLLKQSPESKLQFLFPEGSARNRALSLFLEFGVKPERITFLPRMSRADYLAAYASIDIALDSFPYNGHTTSLEALWMGVPVVTLVGKTVVGRAGLSQLTNLGLPELIARTPEDYLRIAADLAGDLPRLAHLRATLRPRMQASPLMDAPRFARDIERLYRDIWHAWCSRQSPKP